MATVVDAARKGISIVVGAATGGGANAGWFGDGRDGELFVADGETLALDVALDEGQIVKQYTSGYIGTGSLLTAANRCNGMVLLFTGDLTIKGTISMDKKAPLANPMEDQCAAEVHVALCGGLTGGKGGKAGAGAVFDYASYGPIGAPGAAGSGFAFGGGPGGGSGAVGFYSNTVVNDGANGSRAPVGTNMPFVPTDGADDYGSGGSLRNGLSMDEWVSGGAGPGGSGAAQFYSHSSSHGQYSCGQGKSGAAGDAFGGGAVFIFVKGRLTIEGSGKITAAGGDGADGIADVYIPGSNDTYGRNASLTGGGGAAGGGIIVIVHNGDYTNSGSVAAPGGVGGTGASYTYGLNYAAASNGENGEAGTVLIAKLSDLLNAA